MLLREGGEPVKPWLTVILDDYSRTVAGYFLTFDAPSAAQTALALRQAIGENKITAGIFVGFRRFSIRITEAILPRTTWNKAASTECLIRL